MTNLGSGGDAKASPADRVDTNPRDDIDTGAEREPDVEGRISGGNGAVGDAQAIPSSYGASGGDVETGSGSDAQPDPLLGSVTAAMDAEVGTGETAGYGETANRLGAGGDRPDVRDGAGPR